MTLNNEEDGIALYCLLQRSTTHKRISFIATMNLYMALHCFKTKPKRYKKRNNMRKCAGMCECAFVVWLLCGNYNSAYVYLHPGKLRTLLPEIIILFCLHNTRNFMYVQQTFTLSRITYMHNIKQTKNIHCKLKVTLHWVSYQVVDYIYFVWSLSSWPCFPCYHLSFFPLHDYSALSPPRYTPLSIHDPDPIRIVYARKLVNTQTVRSWNHWLRILGRILTEESWWLLWW